MSESSRRYGRIWTEEELTLLVDLYFNGHLTDSHGHDELARCLGRYNAQTDTYHDGAVNEKFAEIQGYLEGRRQPRHPGKTIIALVDRYRNENDHPALRVAARAAWPNILRDYSGPVPEYVQLLLRD